MILIRIVASMVLAVLITACATAGDPVVENDALVEKIETTETTEPQSVPALRYRRLAWTPEMRDRYWLDEIYVPSVGVAFNLDSDMDVSDESFEFYTKLNAFFADEPVGYSKDLYGRDPVKPDVTEIEIPAALASAVQEHARIVKALADSARSRGAMTDAARVLPAVVGSPHWKPPETE